MKFKMFTLALSLAVPFYVFTPPAAAQQPTPGTGGAQQPIAPIGGGTQNAPVAAGRGVSSPDSGSNVVLPQSEPDTHPLTSAELFSLGSAGKTRDIFDPSFFLIQSATLGTGSNNSASTSSSTLLTSITSVGGSLSASRLWSHYSLVVSYTGIGNFYRGSNVLIPNTQSQSLGIGQVVDLGRWTLRIRDDFGYAPQSAFGDESFGGPGLIGQVGSTSVLGGLSSTFSTGETIQTGQADRISNTALGEVDYSASRRSQFTFTGSYAVLKFVQSGFLNSHDVRGQVGYSFFLDPRNTIGLIASYDRTTYQTGVSIQDTRFDLSLGRRITGRLAFQAAGGESLVHFDEFVPSIAQRWLWDASAALNYALRRNDLALAYSHAIMDGSGVLLGSSTHTATASIVHHFTRFTSAGLNGGYTKSTALVTSLAAVSSFNGWYGGVNFSRQIGRHFNATLNYGAQRQTQGTGSCPVTACAPATILQTFGINLGWHPRLIEIN